MKARPNVESRCCHELRALRSRTALPPGWRSEAIDGRMVLSPPPEPGHELIADSVVRCLYAVLPSRLVVLRDPVVLVQDGPCVLVPDLAVVPRDRAGGDPAETGAHALLAAEIAVRGGTGSGRGAKLRAYAAADVPLHLRIDRYAPNGPTTTLFSEPAGEAYRESHAVPFGKPLDLPSPFDVTLETEAFPR
ncbi:Uma2 family endonuclease [Saccharopolyspora sp. NPDC047091]|uniref:Uma2 family endonuclease n=1 Tax=Saccharopolyspora sp. NPDC047091 TaxID=3155924 RepID=UPI0033F5FDA1